ncbi:MAG: DEAD/DEAH box helicase family protein [Treponema sp.]|nr:DEAD/DEAH box helicase family protein [Treponema sp.]
MANKPLKFQFQSGLAHQVYAVDSIVNLFNDYSQEQATDFSLENDVVPNIDPYYEFDEEWLYSNYRSVVEANRRSDDIRADIPIIDRLIYNNGLMLRKTKFENKASRYPVFTVEMETGTGKTYTYFRTIHELRRNYGFRKFIVVVPSIAIYEGTIKAFKQTREHFKTLYQNDNTNLIEYDGQYVSRLRTFSNSSFTEILVMTIGSFNGVGNIIYKPTEKLQGDWLPVEYIQNTRPVLILDESQNYRTDLAREALRTLNPLFAINYSATPVEKYNLVYRLSPGDAFRQKLVKSINVHGVTTQYDLNDDSLALSIVDIKKNPITADIRAYCIRNGVKTGEIIKNLKPDDDLGRKTNNPDFEGFVIEEINCAKQEITFKNQSKLTMKSSTGLTLSEKEVYRVEIETAIRQHFEKQKYLLDKGIKVLTLFFIDRVPHYKGVHDPFIKLYFEKAFDKIKEDDSYFKQFKAEEVHSGYFAPKKENAKNKTAGEDIFFDYIELDDYKGKDKKEIQEAEKEAFSLIMKDKETLLTLPDGKDPKKNVAFIFAHSALREGWDNPNVFNICLLKEPRYVTANQKNTRRQELGRGLRLCVNQEGERVQNDSINNLTVICPEDFSQYAIALQQEYRDTDDIPPPPPTNAARKPAKRKPEIFTGEDFRIFWNNLSRKTEYLINIDTEELIKGCTARLNSLNTVFPDPHIVITKGEFTLTAYTVSLINTNLGHAKVRITKDTNGQKEVLFGNYYPVGFKFGRNDNNLKGFQIVEIKDDKREPHVIFGNKQKLTLTDQITFSGSPIANQNPRTVQAAKTNYPVFNIIDRASKALCLTRPTILSIFKSVSDERKSKLFNNPEGFCTVFMNEIKDELARHVAEKIEYSLSRDFKIVSEKIAREPGIESYAAEEVPPYGGEFIQMYDADGKRVSMEDYFPEIKPFNQRELIEGSEHSLYDFIQKDSVVEENFVKERLYVDDTNGQIKCYFKFPANFKIRIPKIIGNYNPDWGIVRVLADGKTTIQLVRETKGNIDPKKLRFANEGRKIMCAQKHFDALGINYRQVTDKTDDYLDVSDR